MGVWHNHNGSGGPGLPVVEVQKATGAWVDITGDVLHPVGGLDITMAGRQTELAQMDNSTMTATVTNVAGLYTPGYAAASVNMYQGMPVKVKETVGRRTFHLFRGTLSQPEAVYGSHPNEAVVSTSATDWLGGQEQGRTFVSTLAEHILYAAGSGLVGYWPLGAGGDPVVATSVEAFQPFNVTASEFGAVDGPRGDDLSVLSLFDATGTGADNRTDALRAAVDLEMTSADTLTIAFWVRASFPTSETAEFADLLKLSGDGNLLFGITLATNRWNVAPSGFGSWGDEAGTDGPTVNYDTWNLIALRFALSSTQEVWVNGKVSQVTIADVDPPPSSAAFTLLALGPLSHFLGDVAHLQIYTSGYTFAQHVAQYQHGSDELYGGLRWQRSDERIRTLANYAGLTDAEMDLDRGVAYLPRAELAGQTFSTAASAAVATERGRLLMSGDGQLTFHNRTRTRYNL